MGAKSWWAPTEFWIRTAMILTTNITIANATHITIDNMNTTATVGMIGATVATIATTNAITTVTTTHASTTVIGVGNMNTPLSILLLLQLVPTWLPVLLPPPV